MEELKKDVETAKIINNQQFLNATDLNLLREKALHVQEECDEHPSSVT